MFMLKLKCVPHLTVLKMLINRSCILNLPARLKSKSKKDLNTRLHILVHYSKGDLNSR